jgi:hypothetical protein
MFAPDLVTIQVAGEFVIASAGAADRQPLSSRSQRKCIRAVVISRVAD